MVLKTEEKTDILKRLGVFISSNFGDDVLVEVADETRQLQFGQHWSVVYVEIALIKLSSIQWFFTFKMVEETSIQDHLSEFNKVVNYLKI